jgi:aryl-alcohol dehydrogenase-like predicted oxidoreductase
VSTIFSFRFLEASLILFLLFRRIYSNGESEKEMGRAFKELDVDRSQIVVSTKIFFGTGKSDPNQKGSSRKHLIEGLKASLERLQMDYVDVLFLHRPDYGTPIEETVRAVNTLIQQNK